MRRALFISLLIILGLLQFTAHPLFCNETIEGMEAPDNLTAEGEVSKRKVDLSKKFKEATAYFTELKKDSDRRKSAEGWDKAIANFQNLHDLQPKSTYAAASLFMLGRITYSRYLQFKDSVDLEKSFGYYQAVVTLFPWHQLADDSLFTMGRIQLEDKKDPQEAARIYTRITTEYYNGDLTDKAVEKLEKLAREFNTPLPPPVTTATTETDSVAAASSQTPSPPPATTAADTPQASTEASPAVKTSELPNVKNRSYVLPVKYWSSNNYTRIVISTSRPVTYKEELLEKVGEQPRRLFIDFDKSYIEPQYRAPIPIRDGLLQQVRTAQFSPDTVRVVLDIESIESYKIYSLPDPFRVIVDVHGQSNGAVAAPPKNQAPEAQTDDGIVSIAPETAKKKADTESATTTPNAPILILQDYKKNKLAATPKKPAPELNAPISSPALSLAQQLNLGVHRIVIDPGHGGKDPGASAFGMKEKDIVLKVAKKLAAKLKKEMGYEVILTRNDDTFISLEERTAIANTNGADLFISLHLNAHPSSEVHGFETYYLNLSTDSEAIRVAALENATSTHQLSDLQTILSDIMKNSKIDESSRLAQKVQDALSSGLTDRKYPQVKSLGVKQAPFYVLIGAEMPAILIEMAFLSNKTDARQLKKEGYQEALAEEIVKGLKKYIHTITASL